MSSQRKEKQREYYRKNRDHINELKRIWYRDNPEIQRGYYEKNKEYIIKRNSQYQKGRVKSVEQKEKYTDYQKSYYQRNKLRIAETRFMKKYVDVMSDFILSLETF